MIAVLALAAPVAANSAQQDNPAGAAPQTGGTTAVPAVAQEERTIALRHMWARREIKVVYKVNGVDQPEAKAQINEFLRDWRCDKAIDIDPKLIDLLYDLHRALGAQGAIRIVSAYRSEGYNASLLRAGRNVDPNSQHMLGHAVDIVIPGIRGEAVRDMAIKLARGGVGYYPFSWPNFVHVDTGPVRQWIESDPKAAPAGERPRFRKHFKLDCNLTMAEVFTEFSREKILASLPPGASTDPVQPLQNAALSTSGAAVAQAEVKLLDGNAPAAAPIPAPLPAANADHQPAYACNAADSLPSLTRLRQQRLAIKAHRLRKKMAHRIARHHRRARRSHT